MQTDLKFSDLNLSTSLLETVESIGYQHPTPIQAQIIPHILLGKDVLGCAQTGTGKTASFTLPMIDILSKGRARARMPRSLVLVPTRELAMQVQQNFETYSKNTNLKQALLIGGSGFSEQEKLLEKGVDVLIATPGRLLDLHQRGKIMLHDIKIFVLDEADRMLDMGFMPDIEQLTKILPMKRQTLLFSATMPEEIRKLAQKLLKNPVEISITAPTSSAVTITQYACHVANQKEKRSILMQLLSNKKIEQQIIIFCNTKKEAASLSESFSKSGMSTGVLHGDLNQDVRTETLKSFTAGTIKILIASDVAARGLDIESISHVVNYDVPNNRDDYIHRIGRTGRAGQMGDSITFIQPSEIENWNKILSGAKDTILDFQTKEAYTPQTAEKSRRGNPRHKAQEKQPQAAQAPKQPVKNPNKPAAPTPQKPVDFNEPGFGEFLPQFMRIDLPIPKTKTKSDSSFYGVRDEPKHEDKQQKPAKPTEAPASN
ncbi:MAG: DEAD/DEAH box helicase [Alphaproteobacteria bacterium]|nr:DEAD/DEAH box helicase [Alphaproteobacteria bacterium]